MKILVQCRQGTQELKDQLENKSQMLKKVKRYTKKTQGFIYMHINMSEMNSELTIHT